MLLLRIFVVALFFAANVQTQEVRCENFNNPLATFPSGGTSLIWADNSFNERINSRGFCTSKVPSFTDSDTRSSACIGARNTVYADFRRNQLEFVERISGSDSSACYELFVSIQCCIPIFNPVPPQPDEDCETFTGIGAPLPNGGISQLIWADSTEIIERNGNAYCENRRGYDRMAAYDSECLGEDEVDGYRDWDPVTEEWVSRNSGSTNGYCYRMFQSVECCRPNPPAPAPTPPPDECDGIVLPIFGCVGGCFSRDTLVMVKGKGEVPIKSLLSGDHVHVGKGIFEPVYAFGHHTEKDWYDFLQISVRDIDNPIEMTENHMIFVQNEDGTSKAIPAAMLKQDDRLVHADHGTNKVTGIRKVTKRGVYAPLTYSGKVAVNGVIASVYPSAEPSFWGIAMQTWMHLGQGPHRLVCKLAGISLCVDELVDDESSVEEDGFGGMSPMVVRSVKLLQWIGTQETFVQVLVGFLLAVGVFTAYAIEFATEHVVFVAFLAFGILISTAGCRLSAQTVAMKKS